MDFYLFSLILGALGLIAMAASGLSHGTGGHGHGHGHAGDASLHGGHAGAHHDVTIHHHTPGHHTPGHASHGGHAAQHGQHHDTSSSGAWMWQLLSPRVLFALLVGLGATGTLARPYLDGIALALLAVVGGIAFEMLGVRPIWNFFFRFASAPALTLESTLYDTGTAVTRFDATGCGVIALEVDGQVLQVLATLRPQDRGLTVRAGDRLMVEEVDGARNRCVVSWAGPLDPAGGENLRGELGR